MTLELDANQEDLAAGGRRGSSGVGTTVTRVNSAVPVGGVEVSGGLSQEIFEGEGEVSGEVSLGSAPSFHSGADVESGGKASEKNLSESYKTQGSGLLTRGNQLGSPVVGSEKFQVELEVFSGPLDLLVSLIIKNRLDITEVSLAQVTDEFLSYLTIYPDLSQASEFLVIAATLLDIKATQLLPGEKIQVEDQEYLEARDLLFARLLQYRAFKEVTEIFSQTIEQAQRCFVRQVPLEEHFAKIMPQLRVQITPEQLLSYAMAAFKRQPAQVQLEHLHHPQASLAEQAQVIVSLLQRSGQCGFEQLVASAKNQTEVVTRFLALLELYRRKTLDFEQEEALGKLTVRFNPAYLPDFEHFTLGG